MRPAILQMNGLMYSKRNANGTREERERRNRELINLNFLGPVPLLSCVVNSLSGLLSALETESTVQVYSTGQFILCRRPQAAGRNPHRIEHISTLFSLIAQRNFQQFHLRAACV